MLLKKSQWIKVRQTFFVKSPLIIGAFTAAAAFFSYLLVSWLFGTPIKTRVAVSLAALMGVFYYALTVWAVRGIMGEQRAPPAKPVKKLKKLR